MKEQPLNIIYEYCIINISNKERCLIRSNYSKIYSITNLSYKKFRTNFPRFNQNHLYKQFQVQYGFRLKLNKIKSLLFSVIYTK
jgi:hypothetical protein